MNRIGLAAASFLASCACAASAQVYRCAGSALYTDKPCEGAAPVDLRANIIDAGPRGFPEMPQPQAASVMPDRRPRSAPVGEGGSLWDRQRARDLEHRARTAPSVPVTGWP